MPWRNLYTEHTPSYVCTAIPWIIVMPTVQHWLRRTTVANWTLLLTVIIFITSITQISSYLNHWNLLDMRTNIVFILRYFWNNLAVILISMPILGNRISCTQKQSKNSCQTTPWVFRRLFKCLPFCFIRSIRSLFGLFTSSVCLSRSVCLFIIMTLMSSNIKRITTIIGY